MEDLDSLLQDLGKGKGGAASKPKASRAPSSRVDLNELEDLMEDLAAPTAKQMPTVTKVTISRYKALILFFYLFFYVFISKVIKLKINN
jgi:hypothetical protein